MSTQNYIRLRQLIPVAVKLVKWLTVSANISQVNSTAQRINFKNLVKLVNLYEF